MTEPLLRRLHARGERITVAALPWVASVYRLMPQVSATIELPFVHGGLQWTARRALAKTLRGQFDRAVVCPNSLKRCTGNIAVNIPPLCIYTPSLYLSSLSISGVSLRRCNTTYFHGNVA